MSICYCILMQAFRFECGPGPGVTPTENKNVYT